MSGIDCLMSGLDCLKHAAGPSRLSNWDSVEKQIEQGEGKFLMNQEPPWRQPRGKWMVYLVNSHTNATRIGWHLCKIDL